MVKPRHRSRGNPCSPSLPCTVGRQAQELEDHIGRGFGYPARLRPPTRQQLDSEDLSSSQCRGSDGWETERSALPGSCDLILLRVGSGLVNPHSFFGRKRQSAPERQPGTGHGPSGSRKFVENESVSLDPRTGLVQHSKDGVKKKADPCPKTWYREGYLPLDPD